MQEALNPPASVRDAGGERGTFQVQGGCRPGGGPQEVTELIGLVHIDMLCSEI